MPPSLPLPCHIVPRNSSLPSSIELSTTLPFKMTRITRSASIHLANTALQDVSPFDVKLKRKRSDSLGSSSVRSAVERSPSVPVTDAIAANDDEDAKKYTQQQPFSPATSCSMLSSIDSAGNAIRIDSLEAQRQRDSDDTHLHSSSMTSVDERSSPQPNKPGHGPSLTAREEEFKQVAVTELIKGEAVDPDSLDVEKIDSIAKPVSARPIQPSKTTTAEADSRTRPALFSAAPQRKSCDRCFRMKTKCSRAAPGASTEKPCEGCIRRGFGHDCITSRPDFPHPKITMAKRVRREYTAPAQETGPAADTAMSARIRAVQWSRQHTSQGSPSRRDRLSENEQPSTMYAPIVHDTAPKTHREVVDPGHRAASTQHHVHRHTSISRGPTDYVHRDLVSEQQRMTLLPPLSSARQMHLKPSAYHDKRNENLSGIRRSFDEPDSQAPSRQYPELTPSPPLRTMPSTTSLSNRSDLAARNVETLRRTLYESETQDEDSSRHGAGESVRSMHTGDLVSMSVLIAQELGRRSSRADGRYSSTVHPVRLR